MTPPLETTERIGGSRVAHISRRQAVRPVRLSRATRRAHQERRRHPADDLRRQRVRPRLRGNTRPRRPRRRGVGPYEGLPLITDYEESKARARKLSDGGMHAKVQKWIDYM